MTELYDTYLRKMSLVILVCNVFFFYLTSCIHNHASTTALTGEPDPIPRQVNKTHDSPLETKNLAFFGTLCPRGECEGIVIRTGDHTAMGNIAALTTQTEQKPTPINLEIEHFVHIVSGVAFFLGISFFLIGVGLGLDTVCFISGKKCIPFLAMAHTICRSSRLPSTSIAR